jgi:hypothetical protein
MKNMKILFKNVMNNKLNLNFFDKRSHGNIDFKYFN